MNYDVYEVEIDTGGKSYRLLQHVKATDAADAQAKVQPFHPDSQILGAVLWRPCRPSEVKAAIDAGVVPPNTTASDLQDYPAKYVLPTKDAQA